MGDIFNKALCLNMKVGSVIFHEGQYMDIGTLRGLKRLYKEME